MTNCTIIAEAGVNHNGSLDMALALVDAAAEAGADVIKFQTFNATALASTAAPKAEYQVRQTDGAESQLEMLSRLQLSVEHHHAIIAHCAKLNIRFLSTPFDLGSLFLLTDTFGLRELKFGSGELTNAPLLLAAARSGCQLILSTGMGTLGEVEEALGVLAFGMITRGDARPSRRAFREALREPRARVQLQARLTLLHCTTEYPAPIAESNLRAIDTLRAAFGVPVGYSDHTEGWAVMVAAVARGARIVEKHLTLDRTLPGPDHAASVEPHELAQMVMAIRQVESALGDGIKQPGPTEVRNIPIARKSLVAARPIAAGHILSPRDIGIKRPAGGLSPMDYWALLGQPAARAFGVDEPFDPDLVNGDER